jgi:hypothetical protein
LPTHEVALDVALDVADIEICARNPHLSRLDNVEGVARLALTYDALLWQGGGGGGSYEASVSSDETER